MNQWKKFINKVYKTDETNRLIETGDTVNFRLRDGTNTAETVTDVTDDGRKIHWDHAINDTRKEDVMGVTQQHRWSCVYYGGATVDEEILWS